MSLRVSFIEPVVCNAFKSSFCINMARFDVDTGMHFIIINILYLLVLFVLTDHNT